MATSPEIVEVHDRDEWREWLQANHQQSESILLVTYRQDAGERYIPYEAIVEEALCFGWIDSTRRPLHDGRSTLLLTPRKPGSGWSQANKNRVERLVAAGKIAPAGMAKINQAKQDGSWSRNDDAEALVIPDDLARALADHPEARQHFDAFPPSSRRVMLQWVYDARRPETRARRIEEIATKAARNERAR